MSFQIKEILNYLKRHRHYLFHLIIDLKKLLFWKICRGQIAVITTGSGGIGDYLWIRNYLPLIRKRGYKVILIAMAHWKEIVEAFDSDNVDTVRYFESCLSPKKIETLFFKLFKADFFLNFRHECVSEFVRYMCTYNDKETHDRNAFYEEKNNATFEQFMSLPKGFKHTLPIIEPSEDNKRIIKRPYVILVERGNTQGCLSKEQVTSIISNLIEDGYSVVFNGSYNQLASYISKNILSHIIDGRRFSFPEYTWLVNECEFVVTVNTSIYHFAVQLTKPCIVISANEYNTLKLYQDDQEYVFDEKLQKAYDNRHLPSIISDITDIKTINPQRIANAINTLKTKKS